MNGKSRWVMKLNICKIQRCKGIGVNRRNNLLYSSSSFGFYYFPQGASNYISTWQIRTVVAVEADSLGLHKSLATF